MAYPPAYTRTFSFSNFETNNPGQPKPGAQLDAEYDDVSNALTATQNNLALIQRADGKLANGSVGVDQLIPGLFDDVADAIIAAAAIEANRALAYADQAGNSAFAASGSASSASGSAAVAAGAASQSGAAQSIAQTAAADAELSAQNAANSAAVSAQAANDTAGNVAETEDAVEKAYRWAEYLAGPVEPAPDIGPGGTPYPEAVDDGMWSSKWWALKARDIVGVFSHLYWGPHPSAPAHGPDGEEPSQGVIYYDTTYGMMMVWNGTDWVPASDVLSGNIAEYIYEPTADGQRTFYGPDRYGHTLAFDQRFPEDLEVHLDGVLLTRDWANDGTGDYTVDTVNGVVTLVDVAGANLGSVVHIDLVKPRDRAVAAASVSATFVYQATAGQTTFSGVDLFGNNFEVDAAATNDFAVHVNGVLLVNARGTGTGDYDIAIGPPASCTIYDSNGLAAGSVVQIDLLTEVAMGPQGPPGVPGIPGLKGDKGDTGDTGPANSLAIGSVVTGAPGSAAAASITGTPPAQTLNLTLPRGETGPSVNLTIGTVTTGDVAAATITGTSPNFVLHLTLPRAYTLSRYTYLATAGQTAFSGLDLAGNTLNFADGDLVTVHVNGVRLMPNLAGTGDYTENPATDTITILDSDGLTANSVVQIDITRL